MLKILVVIPNSTWCGKREWQIFPYAVLILSAILSEHHDFVVIDANGAKLSEEACQEEIRKINPDVAMVSGGSSEYHRQIHRTFELIKAACPETISILGGVYPTVLGGEAIKDPNIDYIFQGHAEERVLPFLDAVVKKNSALLKVFDGIGYKYDGGLQINPLKSFIGDVKKMVMPDYSKIDLTPYLIRDMANYQLSSTTPSALISTSYGCPYNCVFCASRTVNGRKVAYRPVDDVMAEIDFLVTKYKVKDLLFIDDNMLVDRNRADLLLNTLIERKYHLTWKAQNVAAWSLNADMLNLMQKSGCTQVTIAVESGSQRVLSEIVGKPLQLDIVPGIVSKCKDLGMNVTSNFIIGLPGETWDEIRSTFSFAERCQFDLVTFSIATPLPKTDLYDIAKGNDLLDKNFSSFDERYYGYSKGFITTNEFRPEELMILRIFEWDRINFSTEEKRKKTAELYGLSMQELAAHRKKTRDAIQLIS